MRKSQVEAHIWKDLNNAWCSRHPRLGKKFFFCKQNGRCRGKNNISKGNLHDGLRRNGVVERSSVWKSV
jgi:hypothetical protein